MIFLQFPQNTYDDFYLVLCNDASPGCPTGTHSFPTCYAALLRYCTELCLKGFYAWRNRRNAPSVARFSSPLRPCRSVSVFHGIISTVSKPLRYSLTGSMCDALQAATCGTYSLLKLRYFIGVSVSDSQHTGYGLSASLWDTWGFPWSAHPDLSPHHCDAQWTHPAFVQIPYAEPSV